VKQQPLVLVVDDDADILDAISEILVADGYRVAQARHGVEALERVAEERPKLVLLDLMMPVMDGVAFAHILRARRGPDARVPILVISADATQERVAQIGAAGFLPKPFDIDALLAHVGAIVRLPEARGVIP
jgi:two-component system, chemotaxis family, chemotaxis protein CheY